MDEIAAIPREMMNYIQICDGPKPYDPDGAAMLTLGRTARLIPGNGGIDLPAILSRLPGDITVSVEVPNVEIAQSQGVERLVRDALDASKRSLGSNPGG